MPLLCHGHLKTKSRDLDLTKRLSKLEMRLLVMHDDGALKTLHCITSVSVLLITRY